MAAFTPLSSLAEVSSDGTAFAGSWTLTTADGNGAALGKALWADRVWQVSGTFGGATVQIQGSFDGSTWVAAKDVYGDPAQLTAAGYMHTKAPFRFMRPVLSVAGAGATLTVSLVARRDSAFASLT